MEKLFRIVVADDDIDDQELIQQALKDSKVKIICTVVYDGMQLLDYLLKRGQHKMNTDSPPDLILLDLNMPLMDGFEALKAIKTNEDLKNIPVYVITTSRAESDKRTAQQLGANGFYSKGASSKDLRRIVMEVCYECFA